MSKLTLNRIVATCLVLASICILILSSFFETFQKPGQSQGQDLANLPGSNLYYELGPEAKNKLISNVFAFCVHTYRAETCLHYFITCGEKCKDIVPPQVFNKIRQDFEYYAKYRLAKEQSED